MINLLARLHCVSTFVGFSFVKNADETVLGSSSFIKAVDQSSMYCLYAKGFPGIDHLLYPRLNPLLVFCAAKSSSAVVLPANAKRSSADIVYQSNGNLGARFLGLATSSSVPPVKTPLVSNSINASPLP